MRYLIVDASLHGTGIRDHYEGGYLKPETLGLSLDTIHKLKKWLLRYENEHFNGFVNDDIVDKLDLEGKEIAFTIKNELQIVKMEYFSDARMTSTII